MRRPAFTLLELLVVIAIIAILASIVIIAINPTRMLAQARNTQRRSDVETILSALTQYAIDHSGGLPDGIPAEGAAEICRTGALSCTGGVDLSVLTQNATYLTSLPHDPQAPIVGTGTLYTIETTAGNRLTVRAQNAELDEAISITR